MENKQETAEIKVSESMSEWVKPEVTEFDVNSTTLASAYYPGAVLDGTLYS